MTYNVFGGTLSLPQSINQPPLMYGNWSAHDHHLSHLTLTTFTAMHIQMVNICGKFHPSTK